jgi:hypothetical protein
LRYCEAHERKPRGENVLKSTFGIPATLPESGTLQRATRSVGSVDANPTRRPGPRAACGLLVNGHRRNYERTAETAAGWPLCGCCDQELMRRLLSLSWPT